MPRGSLSSECNQGPSCPPLPGPWELVQDRPFTSRGGRGSASAQAESHWVLPILLRGRSDYSPVTFHGAKTQESQGICQLRSAGGRRLSEAFPNFKALICPSLPLSSLLSPIRHDRPWGEWTCSNTHGPFSFQIHIFVLITRSRSYLPERSVLP